MQWLAAIVWEMFSPFLANTIALWSGSIASIPDGWVLCDGNNGTPDLRDHFAAPASADVAGVPNVTIGPWQVPSWSFTTHKHGYEETYHHHHSQGTYTIDRGTDREVWDGISSNDQTHDYSPVGLTANNADIVIPYYALAYIMRLPS